MPATKRVTRQVLTSGPWKGVRDTIDPFDDDPGLLVDLLNCYIPDPEGASGVYARPGLSLMNAGAAISSMGRGQGVYSHLALDGTTYNFEAWGGHLYRVNTALNTFTDVTPASGVVIDGATTTRLQFVSLNDQLIVSDSVNPPWIASNLSATPITGTYINYDGAGVVWNTQHIVAWGGALVAALKQVGGVYRQTDIAWSEPGTPATGWQQTDFDNNWTLQQTGSSPIYALAGTNVALYYFRQRSIGAISGAIGPDLQTTATHDAIAYNVGTESPASIQAFGNTLYFTDAVGRPWRLPLGGVPQAIWLNMRATVDSQTTAFPLVTKVVTCAAVEPTLNLYLVAVWSPTPTAGSPPIEMYAFDARTGAYEGRWTIGAHLGIQIEAMGVLYDLQGRPVLVIQGSKDQAPAASGYSWSLTALAAMAARLATQDLLGLTTENGQRLATEGSTRAWRDNGGTPPRYAVTERMGYQADVSWITDKMVAITGSPAPCSMTFQTPTTSSSLQGTPSPTSSSDSTWRLVVSTRVIGRGIQVQVQPQTADAQWVLHRVQLIGVPSSAHQRDQ